MFKRNKQKTTLQPEKLAENIAEKAVEAQKTTSKHVKKYLTKRAERTEGVRRFTIGWLILAIGLCLASGFVALNLFNKSHTSAPADGGTYVEGLVGEVGNLNPLFADGNVDAELDRLVFNGLLRYDTEGKLATDLAKSWQISKDGKTYTVKLRDDIMWHDGQPLTADDVVFTVRTIQNPATRSPLYTSWLGVTVSAQGKDTIKFVRDQPLAPFAHVLTTSILPAHLLQKIPASDLRTAAYNNHPIGSGPFVFKVLRKTAHGQQLELSASEHYFKTKPRLDRFMVSAYDEEAKLAKDLKNREITAAVDLDNAQVETLKASNHIQTVQYPLNSGVFAFFKTTQKPFDDETVRAALAKAVDRAAILHLFDARYKPLKGPLLQGQAGYTSSGQQTNLKEAARLLDKAGWKLKNGVRTKGKNTLTFTLTTRDTDEYKMMAEELQQQWAKLGVVVKSQLLSQEQIEQTALAAHEYDVLLFGVSIGADPDVLAYWHSSQARPGLKNFSEWKSGDADLNLDIARSKTNDDLRAARYQAFTKDWLAENPAVALYQPFANYSYNQNAQGFKVFPLNVLADRLTNVEDWTVETRQVYLTP